MQQWREIKTRHPDALVFFRVGDFYEMFYEDAELGARLLDLTLTSRNNGSSRAPLAGIPVHALDNYLQRLVRHGRRVAICEQVEDPSQAKGIVRREVTETVTPGTALSDALLDARRNNFMAAVAGDAAAGGWLGLASADLSTGELRVRGVKWEELPNALGQIEPTELLLPRSWELFSLPGADGAVRTYRGDWLFETGHGGEELKRRFGVLNLDGFGFGEEDEALVGACGALVAYLTETQPSVGECLRPPRIGRQGDHMPLDEMTRRNLELVEPLSGGGSEGTLLEVLDEALTPMGGRLLRRWILAPLLQLETVRQRQDAVAELFDDVDLRRSTRSALREIRDLERLAIKVAAGRSSPRELLAVLSSLERVPALVEALSGVDSPLLQEHEQGIDPMQDLRTLLDAAISPEAPVTLGEGGVIREGYDEVLDELRATREGAVDWIARMQARERERTGIQSLKVGFNKVFGYYLEVTRANLERVPEDYQRKQTLSNAERYVTPELKEWEEKIVGADERILELETQLFSELRERAAREVARLQRLAERIAEVDVLAALAEVAVRRDYVRPEVDEGFGLEIRAGRHPVVETMMPRENFIPNDIRLDEEARVMILTGPNMAGKSTVLRQVGLITLLAQIGSFVPAERARIGIVDRIFTRVGASDNLVRGQSTFMVEMNETAAILNGASERSLVLLDEIGRGTSTWDGLSVATAVTEHLHERTGAKTIFATHYHELTQLSDRLAGVVNFSVAVKEEGENIVFLRSLVSGGADRSYGVEVARLAGLPPEVIGRARTLLHELEQRSIENGNGNRRGKAPEATETSRALSAKREAHAQRAKHGSRKRGAIPESQLALFAASPHPVIERLRDVDANQLTPIQALTLLAELAAQARN